MGHLSPLEKERLDGITSFTLAVSNRDFTKAIQLMPPGEQAHFLDKDGNLPLPTRERLEALRLSTLYNNPLIQVSGGKISGVYDVLPVVAVALPSQAYSTEDSGLGAPEPSSPPTGIDSSAREIRLHQIAETFFKSIRTKNWDQALRLINPHERQDFLDRHGEIKKEACLRLSEADTSSWDALSLMNGKLIGVVLIIPDPSEASGAKTND